MALKGNLRDFSVTQLFNLINLAHKTGTLYVENNNDKVRVYFREGKLAYSDMPAQDNSLAIILFQTNKISANQYRVIKERAGNISDKELGLLLINANYLSQQDILSSLQSHFLSMVNRLFSWGEGLFLFENDRLPPDDKHHRAPVSLENIIIEGTRRMKELEQLQDEIPSLDMALKFSDRPGTNIRNVQPERQRVEGRILHQSQEQHAPDRPGEQAERPGNTPDCVHPAAGRAGGDYPPDRSADAGGPGALPPADQPAQEQPDEQKSLLNRLINRIRSI